MKEARTWNADRYATRAKNRDSWTKNLSDACKGRTPWNKNKKGLQTAWNKNLRAEQQPMFGKKKPDGWLQKYKSTNLARYGEENVGYFAKTSPRSKKEKLLESVLGSDFEYDQRISKYKPDYLNKKTKQIIEVYGDYWHCNPCLYKPTDYHSHLKMTAEQKWALDKQKVDSLTSLGYDVKIIWERDLAQFIKNL
jgi:G:T-mismatch repair DNA endonuclease (very short patch repair protein)